MRAVFLGHGFVVFSFRHCFLEDFGAWIVQGFEVFVGERRKQACVCARV
ncbi:hypothetical protein OIU84_020076, partial [Salix udensis]